MLEKNERYKIFRLPKNKNPLYIEETITNQITMYLKSQGIKKKKKVRGNVWICIRTMTIIPKI